MFSIVTVTWHNQKQCQELVDSIKKNSYYKDHNITVVHNESEGDDISNCDNFHFSGNRGFSFAANHGVRHTKGNYVCIIDDDSTVCENWDLCLLKAHKNTNSNWVASTRVEPIAPHYNISNEEYKTQYYKKYKFAWYKNISNVPLLIPKKFWNEIGGYDEDFPNVGAELGLAKRAYDHGERLFLQTPYSLAHHKQSQSMKRMNGIKQARNNRDRTFYKKYGMNRGEFTKLIGKGKVYEV
jgi:GT2 family glycosyltransferase